MPLGKFHHGYNLFFCDENFKVIFKYTICIGYYCHQAMYYHVLHPQDFYILVGNLSSNYLISLFYGLFLSSAISSKYSATEGKILYCMNCNQIIK